jgi:hypothetical protein
MVQAGRGSDPGGGCLNPLAQVRLNKPVRPHPVICTDERVTAPPVLTAPGGIVSGRRPSGERGLGGGGG